MPLLGSRFCPRIERRKSRENTGASNDIQNRSPMCPYHNIRKNDRRIGLAECRQEIADVV